MISRDLSSNASVIQLGSREIVLLGTAHVSKSSVEEATTLIEALRPDSVAVELCESRLKSIREPERWRNTDIVQIIKQGQSMMLLSQLILAGFQRKLGEKLEVKPGAEMVAAVEAAELTGATLVLADRDIKLTLKRAWKALSFWGALTTIIGLLRTFVSSPEISEQEIERLKQSDVLEESMREFSKAFPELRTALIDERDRYLAEKIRTAPGERVVAIIGAGHLNGVKSYLSSEQDLKALEDIPPTGVIYRLLGWVIPALFVGLVVYGFVSVGAGASFEMVEKWIIVNGSLSALGAAVALAHPLTIATAFVVAPYTALNPFIASGWVAGLVEAMIRKPRVGDLENVYQDLATLKGIWGNRLLKILMIVAFTNLFGTVGSLLGIQQVASVAL